MLNTMRLNKAEKLILFAVLSLASFFILIPGSSAANAAENKILSVSVTDKDQRPVVNVETEKPVGFRYTVYDSQDPRRIIVDFRDMALGGVKESISSAVEPVKEVRVSSFDLTSGKLSRVEILLAEDSEYDVALDGNIFKVIVVPAENEDSLVAQKTVQTAPDQKEGESQEALVEKNDQEEMPVAKKPVADSDITATADTSIPLANAGDTSTLSIATQVKALVLGADQAKIQTNGPVEKYRYFTLTGPTRLVVDVYGVSPQMKKRNFSAGDTFKRVRVGNYTDKTRFVFDSVSEEMPVFGIDTSDNGLLVTWGALDEVPAPPTEKKAPSSPVAINAVEFSVENGRSVLSVGLSDSAPIVKPKQDGDIISFGIKNATISRSLRRIIDASVFPSSVRLVTPYTVQRKKKQDVMFAVELKGPVPFKLNDKGDELVFVVENVPFAEEPFVAEEKKEVSVPEQKPAAEPPEQKDTDVERAVVEPAETEGKGKIQGRPEESSALFADEDVASEEQMAKYKGQRISLVFDNADLRNILQLIAEVSDLNIIATEDVKGSLSIRLIDVPWDQALDIILDIKNLGMLKSGNVVRILPKGKIREMERADLQAVQTREELEPLVTEVISVNYTDLGSVTGPAQNILSSRGKITEDSRNKQLIVTDVPPRVDEVKKLVSILDTPEKQVVIEARIVEANSTFSRDLGVSWGLSYDADGANGSGGTDKFNLGLGGSFVIPPPTQGSVGSAGLATGFTFGRVGIDSTTLDLRISALESSGHGKVISTPRVTTLNGKQASISQGTKIPYQSVGDEGTTTEFIDAVLSLDVTPVINPDGSVILDINAANSSVGSIVPTGSGSAPSVDTKEATTQVLVQNGETTVIGGIFVEDEDFAETGVPLLRSIPILGHLFKSTTKSTVRNELLIFITPRIVN